MEKAIVISLFSMYTLEPLFSSISIKILVIDTRGSTTSIQTVHELAHLQNGKTFN